MDKPEATAQLVKEEINSSLFLAESLKRGIINYSELTRQILPKIKAKNKKANFSSVLISLQRLYDEVKNEKQSISFEEILRDAELIMKTNIVDITLERTKNVVKRINEISREIRWDMGDIMFTIQGTSEITIICDKKNFKKFESIKKSIIETQENLAILSLRESQDLNDYSKNTIGFLAHLLSLLSDKKINIVELATTFKQNIFILKEDDLSMAYITLKHAIDFFNK